MTEAEFHDLFRPETVSIGAQTFAQRWAGWEADERHALLRLFASGHELGLDWHYIGGDAPGARLRAGRRELHEPRARWNLLTVDLHQRGANIKLPYPAPQRVYSPQQVPAAGATQWLADLLGPRLFAEPGRAGHFPAVYPV